MNEPNAVVSSFQFGIFIKVITTLESIAKQANLL